MSRWLGWWVVLLVWGVGGSSLAVANGNFSHLSVAVDALHYLPEGEFRDIMVADDVRHVLRNGAMFPDGGYAVKDGYGEIAHWEPFHLAYLNWILANYTYPWSEDARKHIVFLMGMVAHGMSDQLYDGMYLERHEYFDENGNDATLLGVDGATDGCYAYQVGKEMEIPQRFVPSAELAPLFLEAGSHTVAPQKLEDGQNLVIAALIVANGIIGDEKQYGEYLETYPYACGNQSDADIPGSPPAHGPVVAKHWLVLWGLLMGEDPGEAELTGTFFSSSRPWAQVKQAANPESWVSFTLPIGLDPSTVNQETVVVTDSEGVVHECSIHVYYGTSSHLVNIMPKQDWAPETDYNVVIKSGIKGWKGAELKGDRAFVFSTKSEPAVVADEDADVISDDGVGGEDAVAGDVSVTDVSDLLVPDSAVGPDSGQDSEPGMDGANGDAKDQAGSGKGGCGVSGSGSASGVLLLLALAAWVVGCRVRRTFLKRP